MAAAQFARQAVRAGAGFRTATIMSRAFQTSAALRQEVVAAAPVKKPVGAFRGG